MQCLRMFYGTRDPWHLANAGKYSSCIFSTAISVVYAELAADDPSKDFFFRFMFTSAVFTALYAYWWDIHKDWGLGLWGHQMLRPQMMFKERKWVYYWACTSDLALRFGWMVTTLIPFDSINSVLSSEVTMLFEALELFRRAQWGIFRLENEQLHKVDTATVDAVLNGFLMADQGPENLASSDPPAEATRKHSRTFTCMADIDRDELDMALISPPYISGGGKPLNKGTRVTQSASTGNLSQALVQGQFDSGGNTAKTSGEPGAINFVSPPLLTSLFSAPVQQPLLQDEPEVDAVDPVHDEENMFNGIGLPDCFDPAVASSRPSFHRRHAHDSDNDSL